MLKNFEHAPNMCFSNLKEELIFCAEVGCAKTYTVKRSCGLQVFCRVLLQGQSSTRQKKHEIQM